MLLMTLHPELILRNNTPTGGDMGAHVYGPAYLRDFLLPHFRLTGWSNDWYSGFPMYRFYMVVPALAVLLVDLILPYGIALKIIAVLGILTLPVCTWLFGKFAKFLFPIPELLTLASVVFLYDESFTIYGGNIASTMAGEFSFSISLSLAVLSFGLLVRAFEEHRGKMLTALVVALSALSHGIVLLFVFGGVVLLAAVWFERRSTVTATTVSITAILLSSFWVLPFLTSHAYMTDISFHCLDNCPIFGVSAFALVAGEIPPRPAVHEAVVGRLGRDESPPIYSLASRIRSQLAEGHFLKPKTDY
ncbi:MAG: hypothetical protein EB108_06965 [Actinobacteria bacterium]|nr:hypothetical protein [Actinomycetota bacterium]